MEYDWVFLIDDYLHLSKGTIGKVLDEKKGTLQVHFFTENKGYEIAVVPKKYLNAYPLQQELEDLNILLFQAYLMKDFSWFEQLKQRYDVLKKLLETHIHKR